MSTTPRKTPDPLVIPIAALGQALAGPGPHPSVERLAEAAAGELAPEETAAITAHAAGCAACAAELDLARAFAAEPAVDADVRWIVERLRGGETKGSAPVPPAGAKVLPMRRATAPARRWAAWAAAASIVLATAVGFVATRDAAPPALPDRPAVDVVRGGEIVWRSPTGVLPRLPETFSWDPVPGAVRYGVAVVDVLDSPVAGAQVDVPRWTPSVAQRAAIETFVTYRLRVVALGSDGGELAGSVAELRLEPLR